MLERKLLFDNVIELNFQAGVLFGCNVYLVFDSGEWILIDIGYEEVVSELIELIRQLDFPFARCKTLVVTHTDVDHSQGLAKAKQLLKTTVTAHPLAVPILETGDRVRSMAEIPARQIDLGMPPVRVDRTVSDGEKIQVGSLELEVWHSPGHTENHLSLRLGNLLFSGDTLYRDGCVGAIDAQHGSDLLAFMESLRRMRDCQAEWLLPAHGPPFRKDDRLIDDAIERLDRYQHMADFGMCAVDWPLMEEWEREVAEGIRPF
jgi:glyoxylase-like metal-dependent hydrolase (beta-lactamase superfamily II)